MTGFLQQMAEQATDGILYADAEGIIRYWNNGCEKLFGFTRQEAVGTHLDLIIPEKHRKRHWDGYHAVLATGETGYHDKMLTVPALTKSGEKLLIRFSVQIIRTDGVPAGFSAIIRRYEKEGGK